MSSYCLLISSCDAYRDLHNHLIESLVNFTPEELDKYILTETYSQETNCPSVKYLHCKTTSISWSSMMSDALITLKDRYSHVIVTFDDFFLVKKVSKVALDHVFNDLVNHDADCIKLIAKPTGSKYDVNYSIVRAEAPYRHTCVWAFWKINTLIKLLSKNYSPWEFEYNSPSDWHGGKILVVRKSIVKAINAVVKGKKTHEYARFEKVYGVNDLREKMSWKEIFFRRVKRILHQIKHKRWNIFS